MSYDLPRTLDYLVPGAICDTSNNDYSRTVWNDPRPMPTEAECLAAWPLVQAQDLADAHNEAILAQLAANDASRGIRAISEALSGDPTRLAALQADQAALRAMLR